MIIMRWIWNRYLADPRVNNSPNWKLRTAAGTELDALAAADDWYAACRFIPRKGLPERQRVQQFYKGLPFRSRFRFWAVGWPTRRGAHMGSVVQPANQAVPREMHVTHHVGWCCFHVIIGWDRVIWMQKEVGPLDEIRELLIDDGRRELGFREQHPDCGNLL